mmetsp:Transcript_34164/g.73955  ORF Transcript_34164/g.73955 Transcript_34164/m.73955 type:complete len:478 (-) Transcript_34164:383-1816(-)|eukprot:CAMPEP_0196135012 /NCGR_PEP_ID=MMETSP0910-20130528/3790_1 /TAXON_ID=49265 /ORGANISM="Thalassiosira rotula, Strain GSO102" /LENGTH=477 /DNA_ID=CAMNT_0041395085 /DNA_START=71 /DNA_END=1504 /DNA_ORIENTATION=-
MRTPKAIISAAAYCAVATTITNGFQSSILIRPEVRSSRNLLSKSSSIHHATATANDDNIDNNNHDNFNLETGPLGGGHGISSEEPRSLGPKRSFLGMRRESGVMRRMMMEQQQHQQQQRQNQQRTTTTTSTALSSSPTALMPDGGLSPCVIKVLGVGGGGSNAVDRMLDTRIGGVEFWAINTDAQALGRSKAKGAQILNIGSSVTRGLGAGGDPNMGRLAAEESREEISAMVSGADLCFITSGMGGGTGSGAAPVVAEISKESGALTVGIVTKPFAFEGRRRMRQATEAIDKLREHVDTVIIVSNNKLLDIIPENTPLEASFRVADDILRQGVVGISEIIVRPGLINVDFADVRSVMQDAGTALMGIGTGSGKTSAEDAAVAAISSPLLDAPVDEATGVVFNIIGGESLSLQEVDRAAKVIYNNVHEDANVIFGALVDDEITDGTVSITVLATGFYEDEERVGGGGGGGANVPDFMR